MDKRKIIGKNTKLKPKQRGGCNKFRIFRYLRFFISLFPYLWFFIRLIHYFKIFRYSIFDDFKADNPILVTFFFIYVPISDNLQFSKRISYINHYSCLSIFVLFIPMIPYLLFLYRYSDIRHPYCTKPQPPQSIIEMNFLLEKNYRCMEVLHECPCRIRNYKQPF